MEKLSSNEAQLREKNPETGLVAWHDEVFSVCLCISDFV